MYQQLIIVGNVGGDPEFQYTAQGIAVCKFSVAVNRVTGKGEQRQQKTTWFRCTVWRERAETASTIIRKGQKVMVIGEIEASAYIKDGVARASLDMLVHEFRALDRVEREPERERETLDVPF
jgi:single-strand DNA-binding protein